MARYLFLILKSNLYSLSESYTNLSKIYIISLYMELRDREVSTKLNNSRGASIDINIDEMPCYSKFCSLSRLKVDIEMRSTIWHQFIDSVGLDNQSSILKSLFVEVKSYWEFTNVKQLELLLFATAYNHVSEVAGEVRDLYMIDIQGLFLLLPTKTTTISRCRSFSSF